MKKFIMFCLVGLMAATTMVSAKEDNAGKVVTHPQLAELLVKTLGLVRFLPNPSTTQQKFDVLMQNGICPEKGWLLDAVVTKADLSRVLVQALRRTDEVENPNDPQSWIDALAQMGITLGRMSETIHVVEALPDAISQSVGLQTTDPLAYNTTFSRETAQYGVTMETATRSISEMEMISGEFRPIGPTPH